MTPQLVNKIIDYFADKTLSIGCYIESNNQVLTVNRIGPLYENDDITGYLVLEPRGDEIWEVWLIRSDFKILGHPVYIGHVLEKIFAKDKDSIDDMKLIPLWRECGLSKSLQEIASCGYEEIDYEVTIFLTEKVIRLKDPKAMELFSFLNSII